MLTLYCPRCKTRQRYASAPSTPLYCWDCLCHDGQRIAVEVVEPSEPLPPTPKGTKRHDHPHRHAA